MTGYRVAILWRGDQETRRAATPYNNRYRRVFEELIAVGIDARPVIYADDIASEVRNELVAFDAVLVWVDPIHEGQTRQVLDTLLRDVAAQGRWVSAHPEVILKMGVKEVLYRTRHLGWGTETHLYSTMTEFASAFPERLRSGAPRVIKQNRGNGGQGVWKVELTDPAPTGTIMVSVLHARRGSVPQQLSLEQFLARCEPYFASGGCIIDRPYQPRLLEGMIRCYMGVDRVVGFGHQLIKALIPPPAEGPDAPNAQPGPRIMYPPAVPGAPKENGRGMDAADDGDARNQCDISSHHMGRRFSLWTARRFGRGQLRLVRDQRQLSLLRFPIKRRPRSRAWRCNDVRPLCGWSRGRRGNRTVEPMSVTPTASAAFARRSAELLSFGVSGSNVLVQGK